MGDERFSERDIRGVARLRGDLRPRSADLLRPGRPATPGAGRRRAASAIEEILGDDPELISIVFEESIAETLERYVDDQRLRDALDGPGVIGTFAGPRDPGTASVHLMHHQGDLLGLRRRTGATSRAGMGRVSFAIAAGRAGGRAP